MLMAKQEVNEANINLLTTKYQEDIEIIPDHMKITDNLTFQMGDYHDFLAKRKLPCIQEIFSRLKTYPADYYIYTNVDISLRPSFYQFVLDKINSGHDAFVINRRTISKDHSAVQDYDKMCAEEGESHPGFDCFVFKASMLDNFVMGNAGLGANWVGRVIITNLIVNAENFKIFKDEFQTFHIGDDRSWKNPKFADYDEFNRQELIAILLKMRAQFGEDKSKLSYLNEFLYKDMKWNEDGKNPYIASNQNHQKPTVLTRILNKISNWNK